MSTNLSSNHPTETGKSASLELVVRRPQSGDSRFPSPAIAQAIDGVLDMNIVSSDVFVSIAPWPLIVSGQTYSLSIQGQKTDGSPYELVIVQNRALKDSEVSSGPKCAVERLDLENLRDNSDFTLIFSVAFAPGMSGITFPTSVFRIIQEEKRDPLTLSGPSSAYVGYSFIFSAKGGKPPYAYLSSNNAVARMTDAAGNGVAVSPGSCAISVTDNAKGSATHNFTVVKLDPPVVTPRTYTNVRPGQTYTFEALGGKPPYRWTPGVRPEEIQLHNTSGPRVTVTTTSRFIAGTNVDVVDANGLVAWGLLSPPLL
jgi:hypothetical protein